MTVSDSIDTANLSFTLEIKNSPPVVNVKQDFIKAYDVHKIPIRDVIPLNSYFSKTDSDTTDTFGFYFTN